jgi:hypothetical protein
VIDIVAAHLIRHPESDLYQGAIRDFLRRLDPPETPDYALYLALYCLAGTYGDTAMLDRTVALIRASTQSEFRTLDAVHRFFSQGARGPIGSVLPILQPLSLEMTYAMLTWEQQRPPPPPPTRR